MDGGGDSYGKLRAGEIVGVGNDHGGVGGRQCGRGWRRGL